MLSADAIHICPVDCCYIASGEKSFEVVCPHCDNRFETGKGHVCLELIRLSEPAQ